jgi:hypothetical protein
MPESIPTVPVYTVGLLWLLLTVTSLCVGWIFCALSRGECGDEIFPATMFGMSSFVFFIVGYCARVFSRPTEQEKKT